MTASLTLAPRLDLSSVAAFAAQIESCQGADLTLDAGRVEHLGALPAQLLVAATRHWQAAGHRLTVAPRSAAFADALTVMGLADHLAEEASE